MQNLIDLAHEGIDIHQPDTPEFRLCAGYIQMREALDLCRLNAFLVKFPNDDAVWRSMRTALQITDKEMASTAALSDCHSPEQGKSDER